MEKTKRTFRAGLFFWKLTNKSLVSDRNFSVRKYPYFKKIKQSVAFTLVELLVSVGIFTVITSVAVFSHNQFNASIVLTNLAYEIALSIRQAQVYGVTVKAPGSTIVFNSGYGIHFFDPGDDSATKLTKYSLFEDKAPLAEYTSFPNGTYDSGESLEIFYLNKGNKIQKICFNNSSITCTNTSAVDISFVRPNPDAVIKSGGSTYNEADICVMSPDGRYKKVLVEGTGQISVVADDVAVCN